MTTEQAIAGIRERHGDTIADEIQATMDRLDALPTMDPSVFSALQSVADNWLGRAGLRSRRVRP